MTPPATARELRERLAGLPPTDRVEWLSGLIRQEAAGGRPAAPPSAPLLSLVSGRPDLLRTACAPLAGEPATAHLALALLARLHNRLEEFGALRDVLRRAVALRPEDPKPRRELLRTELLAPSPDPAERAANLALGAAGLTPLAALSFALQRSVAEGLAADPAPLLAALGRHVGGLDAASFPPALARIAAARNVAIVGNGSATLGRGLGPEIEAHDAVVRLNYPILHGHEADVGRRTDAVLFAEPKRAELPALMAREPGYDAVPALALGIALRDTPGVSPPRLPRALGTAAEALAYRAPTTGFLGVLLAAVLLRRPVTLYGFDFFRPGAPGHYFGPATAAQHHELAYERWYAEAVLPLLAPGLRRAAA